MKKFFLLFILSIPFFVIAQQLPEYKVTRYDTTDIKGYYFLTSINGSIVLDKDINVIYYQPNKAFFDFTMQRKGLMVYQSNSYLYFIDSTFKVVDSFTTKNNVRLDSHDRLILPNGNVILLGMEKAKISLSNYPDIAKTLKKDSLSLLFPVIQEQDKQHRLLFDWRGKDYFKVTDADSLMNDPGDIHSNALALDDDGNILLSSKNLNEITKINRKTGAIMWRLGGKRNEFKFINCPVPFYGQHDIKKTANGHYTLFDNGDSPVPHKARAMEFELDETNKNATLVWSYETDTTTEGRGSVQRLSDGNTLIGLGRHLGTDICFEIVSPSGKKIVQVNGLFAYRVKNYPELPFKLHRPVITCFDSAGVNYLDAGAGYKTYKWNTGDSTRIIKPKNAGSYYVFISYGNSGYISSEKYIVSDILKPCDLKPSVNRNKKQVKTKKQN